MATNTRPTPGPNDINHADLTDEIGRVLLDNKEFPLRMRKASIVAAGIARVAIKMASNYEGQDDVYDADCGDVVRVLRVLQNALAQVGGSLKVRGT